jgi:anti-anti-sigma factor
MSTHQRHFASTFDRDREPLMSIELTSCGPVTVIAVSGEIDMSNAHLLTELAEHAMRDEPLRLVLDLAKVTFFSSAGVHALFRIRRAVMAHAGQLILRDPSPITLKVLSATCVLHSFQV